MVETLALVDVLFLFFGIGFALFFYGPIAFEVFGAIGIAILIALAVAFIRTRY